MSHRRRLRSSKTHPEACQTLIDDHPLLSTFDEVNKCFLEPERCRAGTSRQATFSVEFCEAQGGKALERMLTSHAILGMLQSSLQGVIKLHERP